MRINRFVAAFGAAVLLAGTSGAAIAAEFRADLTGGNEVTQGDSDGWGRVKISIDDTLNVLCADVEIRALGHVKSAQIYRGKAGVTGEPVVALDPPEDDDADDCDNIGDTLADEIQANPTDFYVSIVTDDFPQGAIRGQITPGEQRKN